MKNSTKFWLVLSILVLTLLFLISYWIIIILLFIYILLCLFDCGDEDVMNRKYNFIYFIPYYIKKFNHWLDNEL